MLIWREGPLRIRDVAEVFVFKEERVVEGVRDDVVRVEGRAWKVLATRRYTAIRRRPTR